MFKILRVYYGFYDFIFTELISIQVRNAGSKIHKQRYPEYLAVE